MGGRKKENVGFLSENLSILSSQISGSENLGFLIFISILEKKTARTSYLWTSMMTPIFVHHIFVFLMLAIFPPHAKG